MNAQLSCGTHASFRKSKEKRNHINYFTFSTNNLNFDVKRPHLYELNQTIINCSSKRGQNPRCSSKARLSTFQNLLNVKRKIKITKSIFPNTLLDRSLWKGVCLKPTCCPYLPFICKVSKCYYANRTFSPLVSIVVTDDQRFHCCDQLLRI